MDDERKSTFLSYSAQITLLASDLHQAIGLLNVTKHSFGQIDGILKRKLNTEGVLRPGISSYGHEGCLDASFAPFWEKNSVKNVCLSICAAACDSDCLYTVSIK